MSRYLSRGKRIDNNEWIEGYYVNELRYDIMDSREYRRPTIYSIVPNGDYNVMDIFPIYESTISQCAKSNKFGKLWEGDIFWDCLGDGIIGVIEWDDDYDGWIVRLVPNVEDGGTVPDFDCTLETFRLDEYDGNDYKVIFDWIIGNRHDYKEK